LSVLVTFLRLFNMDKLFNPDSELLSIAPADVKIADAKSVIPNYRNEFFPSEMVEILEGLKEEFLEPMIQRLDKGQVAYFQYADHELFSRNENLGNPHILFEFLCSLDPKKYQILAPFDLGHSWWCVRVLLNKSNA